MRYALFLILISFPLALLSCGGDVQERTPVETLKLYHQAVVDKDITQMKLLLSEATLKLHADQAKGQNVTLDEIVQRETFFPASQLSFKYKPAKIDGNKATVQVENSFGGWDEIILVKESGAWKIDKKGTAQQIIEQGDIDVQKLDDQIDSEREKINKQLEQLDAASPTPATDGTSDEDPAPANPDSGSGLSVDPPPAPAN